MLPAHFLLTRSEKFLPGNFLSNSKIFVMLTDHFSFTTFRTFYSKFHNVTWSLFTCKIQELLFQFKNPRCYLVTFHLQISIRKTSNLAHRNKFPALKICQSFFPRNRSKFNRFSTPVILINLGNHKPSQTNNFSPLATRFRSTSSCFLFAFTRLSFTIDVHFNR
jgi:hypothetical protein